MKRSAAVVLIGMGAAALAACGKHDDCKDKDPNSEACRSSHTSSVGAHGGWGWFGGSSSSGSSEAAATTEATSRGGIGATGEGHASAGGEGGGHGGGGGE